jgi:membrane dipeptidase
MSRAAFCFLMMFALAGAAPAQPSRPADVAVVDLRVGLARSITQPGYLVSGVGQAGIVELEKGHVVGALLPFPAGSPGRGSSAAEAAYLELSQALRFSDRFTIGKCRIHPPKIAVWLELDAADALVEAPSSVGLWVTRGVRVFGLVGTQDSALATAASAPSRPGTGLTARGIDVVRRILAAGALVDVSNASERTIDDVLALAREAHAPVIATHANARALADQPRNLSDRQIREIAQSGGIIGVTAAHGQLAPGRVATLRHLVRQIVYMVGIAGPEHVALGTGFEAGVERVQDFRNAADLPRLAGELNRAGLNDHDLELVMSQNALRVLCPSPLQ